MYDNDPFLTSSLGRFDFNLTNSNKVFLRLQGLQATYTRYIENPKKAQAQDQSDDYEAKAYKVAADSDVSQDEYADAQKQYQHLSEIASSPAPTGDANARNEGPGTGNQWLPPSVKP